MNAFLANLYGTGSEIGTNPEIEKLAEAQVIDEQLRSEGIDVNQLSGEDILKCAYALFGDESAIIKSAQEEGEEEEGKEEGEEEEESEEKEASEKLAEADFLGRVMAHSFYQEKQLIEKQAGIKDKALSGLEYVGGKVTPDAVMRRVVNRAASKAPGKALPVAEANKLVKKVKRISGGAAGGVAAGGAGYGAYRALRKKKK